MNNVECFFALASWIAYQVILLRIDMPLRQRLLQAVVALLVVFWCFLGATQIVTIDEGVGIAETSGHILQTWQLGEMRTTDVLFAALRKISPWFGVPLDPLKLKGLHGFFCIVMHAALVVTVTRLFAFDSRRAEHVTGATLLLLLPTSLIAIKVINYDFFVMEMMLLVVFLALLSFKTGRSVYFWMAVPLSALAAQEKLLAAPIMYGMAFAAGYCPAPGFARWSQGVAAAARVLIAFLVAAATLIACGVLMAALEPQHAAELLNVTLFSPLTLFGGTLAYFALHAAPDQYATAPFVVSLLLVAVLAAASAASRPLFREARLTALAQRVPWRVLCVVLALSFYLLAAASYASLTMYWAPYHPMAEGAFHPLGTFNGVAPHYGAVSHLGHLAFSCAAAAAMFWGGVPTAVWLALGVGLMLAPRGNSLGVFGALPFVLVLCALAMPIAWGVLQLPTGIGAKYFNVGILLLSISTVWLLCAGLASLRPVARHGLSAALIAIYLGELALFLPLDFDFRPVFADIPLAPTSGEPTFGWPGWGEEVALAAKQLEQRIAVGEKVTLRYFYPGGLLGSGRIATVLGAGAAEYDEHEYFVISRLAVVEKLCVFPTGIPAEFTIGRSDRPYAWVFRGDRLKSAGFRFD